MSRSFSARSGSPRGPLALGFIATLSLLVSSCLGVLGVDEYASAPESLCSLLERCYGPEVFPGCRRHVAGQLELAGPGGRDDYLKTFADCLDNCAAATACLDNPFLCHALRQTCGDDEQCCGFSEGRTACTGQTCCVVEDAPCSEDIDCCAGSCSGGKCRPPACRGFGTACTDSADCCSGSCTGGVCSSACSDIDGTCTNDSECCTNRCGNGSCRKNNCGAAGALCVSDADCCNDTCDTKLGICGTAGCFSEGIPCSIDASCCNGLSCDPVDQRCAQVSCTLDGASCLLDTECCTLHCMGSCQCAPIDAPCTQAQAFACCSGVCKSDKCADCAAQDTSCNSGTECCSQVCMDGKCCNQMGCSHGVCEAGNPLSAKDCTPQNVGAAEASCIDAICAQDPKCCCTDWDQSCVDKVATVCNFVCPVTP